MNCVVCGVCTNAFSRVACRRQSVLLFFCTSRSLRLLSNKQQQQHGSMRFRFESIRSSVTLLAEDNNWTKKETKLEFAALPKNERTKERERNEFHFFFHIHLFLVRLVGQFFSSSSEFGYRNFCECFYIYKYCYYCNDDKCHRYYNIILSLSLHI